MSIRGWIGRAADAPRPAHRRPGQGVRVLLLALALLIASAAIATSAVIQRENIRITLLSQVMPYKLPRVGTAPIAIFISGHVDAVQGPVPDQLERLTVKVNRHAVLQSVGLPSCQIRQVQPGSTTRALARCGEALVGSGRFWAHIVLPDQGAYPTEGRLLIFNGRVGCGPRTRLQNLSAQSSGMQSPFNSSTSAGRDWPSRSRTQGGRQGERTHVRDPQAADRGRRDAQCQTRPALLAHIFTAHPFATSFVLVFSMRRIHGKGAYGTELSASLPEALGTWGYVDRIKLTLKRRYSFRGRELSYFNAGCPAIPGASRASFDLAYATFAFAGDREIGVQVDKTCGVAKP